MDLQFDLPRSDNLQWAEFLVETSKDYSFIIWLTVNSKISFPMAPEPYLKPNLQRGNRLPLVQRIPWQLLEQGRNTLELRAEHALEGTSRDTTKLYRVIFYGRKTLETALYSRPEVFVSNEFKYVHCTTNTPWSLIGHDSSWPLRTVSRGP